jgi:hypothetical protein
MSVSLLFLVGRVLLVVPFVLIGVDRVLDAEARGDERAWSAMGVLAAAAVVLGAWGDVAALVLGLTAIGLGVVERRHSGPGDAVLLRSVGLLGGAVITAACFAAVGTALDLTLSDPVMHLDLR